MVFSDQTTAFRALLPASSPGASSSKGASPARSALSSGTSSRSRSRLGRTRRKERDEEDERSRDFLKEAYRIHNRLTALSSHLTSIRKPYLSLTEPPPLSRRRPPPTSGPNGGPDGEGQDDDEASSWARWHGVKYLTDREREEIDLRGKMILRRCRERVGILEEGERARQKKVVPPSSTLYTLLPSLAPAPPSPTDALITAHRASVLWFLTSLLARASAQMTELQEERSKRRAERGRTLGEGAEREARLLAGSGSGRGAGGGVFEKALAGLTGHAPDVSGGVHGAGGSANGLPPPEIEIDPALSTLSPAQIQAFESENNALVTHLESTLTSVLAAEKSLLEVSELQTQLIQHLVQQTEMVDMLYEQAVGSVGEMKGAETQLKKARERSGEARLFLMVFLIGASMALLFLDWYS